MSEADVPQANKLNLSSFESISKTVAVILTSVYASGFLIASLNDFRFGFSVLSPLRPRILAAGGWFLVFVLIPCTLATELRKRQTMSDQDSKRNLIGLITAYVLATGLARASSAFIFDYGTSTSGKWTIEEWIELGTIIGVPVVVICVSVVFGFKTFHKFKDLFILIVFIIPIAAGISSLVRTQTFQGSMVSVWLLAMGAVTFFVLGPWSEMATEKWSMLFILLMVSLAFFSTTYYPHIKASWGGGSPIAINVGFAKDVPFIGGQSLNCLLLEETDQGIYIAGNEDKHATFIPRNEITYIHFGEGFETSLIKSVKKIP